MISFDEQDPFYDGKSHLPSGLEHEANPKAIRSRGNRTKARRSATTFNQKTREYWEKQGFMVEKVETMQTVSGAVVKQDFCGCFDFMALKKGEVVLIQVTAKDETRRRLRKMLESKEYRPGMTRRKAIERFQESGWKMVIHWFDQPGGDGTKWVQGIEELTPELIDDIDKGRRTKRAA